MLRVRSIKCWLVGLIALPGAGTALAQAPRDLLAQGNEHFQAGRFEEALAAYEQIDQSALGDLSPAEWLSNRAAANYRLGRHKDARELWTSAATLKDAAFEAATRYNIGNTHYAEALQQTEAAQPNVTAAIQSLERAIEDYRVALQLDPGLASARANLELAAKLRKELREQSTSAPSSQSQNQEQSDPNQPKENEQQNQSGQSDPNQPKDPQSQPSDDGSDQSDQRQQPQSQPQSQPQDDPNNNAAKPEPQPPGNPQTQPSEGEEQAPPVEVNLTPEQAEKLLQMLRDAEKARREMLRARMRPSRPVERDW